MSLLAQLRAKIVQISGTSANDVVMLDGSAKLPAVDASQLTNVPITGIPQGGPLTETLDGGSDSVDNLDGVGANSFYAIGLATKILDATQYGGGDRVLAVNSDDGIYGDGSVSLGNGGFVLTGSGGLNNDLQLNGVDVTGAGNFYDVGSNLLSVDLNNRTLNDAGGNLVAQWASGNFALSGGITGDGSGLVGIVAANTYAGNKTATGTATTTFTVAIGHVMPNTNYSVTTEGNNALSAAVHYVTNKTTTTFDVTYLAGLTGAVSFDWSIQPYN